MAKIGVRRGSKMARIAEIAKHRVVPWGLIPPPDGHPVVHFLDPKSDGVFPGIRSQIDTRPNLGRSAPQNRLDATSSQFSPGVAGPKPSYPRAVPDAQTPLGLANDLRQVPF